jgi:hypothetical protein
MEKMIPQTVPLRPFLHKAYLAVDLPHPSLGGSLVATFVTVGQVPGDVMAFLRPLTAMVVDEIE